MPIRTVQSIETEAYGRRSATTTIVGVEVVYIYNYKQPPYNDLPRTNRTDAYGSRKPSIKLSYCAASSSTKATRVSASTAAVATH